MAVPQEPLSCWWMYQQPQLSKVGLLREVSNSARFQAPLRHFIIWYCPLRSSLEDYIATKFWLTAINMTSLREVQKNSKAFVHTLEDGKGSVPKSTKHTEIPQGVRCSLTLAVTCTVFKSQDGSSFIFIDNSQALYLKIWSSGLVI